MLEARAPVCAFQLGVVGLGWGGVRVQSRKLQPSRVPHPLTLWTATTPQKCFTYIRMAWHVEIPARLKEILLLTCVQTE